MNTAPLPGAVPDPGTKASDWRRDYERLRRRGVRAVDAHRCATTPARPVQYRDGPGDAITLELGDDPTLSRFIVTAMAEPVDDPAPLDLGEFTHTSTADTITVYTTARRAHFRPAYSLAQRRADLSRLGYARGPAHDLALRQVHEDARLYTLLEARYVCVQVRKAGVLLGQAGIETWFRDDEDHRAVMATAIGEHRLLDDALAEARRALPPLIAALSA